MEAPCRDLACEQGKHLVVAAAVEAEPMQFADQGAENPHVRMLAEHRAEAALAEPSIQPHRCHLFDCNRPTKYLQRTEYAGPERAGM